MLSRYLQKAPRYCPVMLLFLTGRCNLKCRMCGVCDLEHGYESNEELSTDQWKRLISEAAEKLGTSLVVISGGEALMRDDVFEIIAHATDLGVATHLCTNALLLTEEKIRLLQRAGVATVSFSIDGSESSIHEQLRGPQTFERATSAVKKFKALAPEVHLGINFVITRHNYRFMMDMVRFAKELGVHQLKFAPIHTNLLHKDKSFDNCQDLFFQESDLDELKQEVKKVQGACSKNRLMSNSAAFFDGIAHLYGTPHRVRCYAGYAICAISPAGCVSPCSNMDSPFSITEQSIADIWKEEDFHNLRKQVHRCTSSCWDTAYTELSLWLRPRSLLFSFPKKIKDIFFYFNGRQNG
ncbi:MAG: radical SAM protein [Candidatus Hydrogenedentes bacterium]|jgi:MoaA/NifB/PqqE/SkfB family radical SAM enzyme|nr:radical SAM protein [Candidatus Hydrogenedentota bacterium]